MKAITKHVCIMATCLMATTMVMANRSGLKVTSLQTEYQQNPIGIDQQKPRFSGCWKVISEIRCRMHTTSRYRSTEIFANQTRWYGILI
jgi:hypothetical protein